MLIAIAGLLSSRSTLSGVPRPVRCIDSAAAPLIALEKSGGHGLPRMDSKQLRHIMGHFATGVTVVTTKDAAGSPFGLTANAFASLSLDPPLVLVCVDKAAQCYSCFAGSGHFVVNVLSEEQEEVSRRFATKG